MPVRTSIADDDIACLEDGRRSKSLKRRLPSAVGLSPERYRAEWNLPRDCPRVAPARADKRSEPGRRIGQGRKAEG